MNFAATGRSNAFTTQLCGEFHVYPSFGARACQGSPYRFTFVPSAQASRTKSSATASFRQRSGSTIPASMTNLSIPTVDSFKTGDDPPGAAARYFRRIFQADHRGFRDIVWLDLHLSRPTRSIQRQPEPTVFRISRPPSNTASSGIPEHEFVMSVGLSVEWGGTGSAERGRRPVQYLHADDLFRQRSRRSARHPVLDSAGCDHRARSAMRSPGRVRPPRFGIDPDTGDPTSTPNFIRGC